MNHNTTVSAEIEIGINRRNEPYLHFTDAHCAQWTVVFDALHEYTKDELIDCVTEEIELAAREIAESLVPLLRVVPVEKSNPR